MKEIRYSGNMEGLMEYLEKLIKKEGEKKANRSRVYIEIQNYDVLYEFSLN